MSRVSLAKNMYAERPRFGALGSGNRGQWYGFLDSSQATGRQKDVPFFLPLPVSALVLVLRPDAATLGMMGLGLGSVYELEVVASAVKDEGKQREAWKRSFVGVRSWLGVMWGSMLTLTNVVWLRARQTTQHVRKQRVKNDKSAQNTRVTTYLSVAIERLEMDELFSNVSVSDAKGGRRDGWWIEGRGRGNRGRRTAEEAGMRVKHGHFELETRG